MQHLGLACVSANPWWWCAEMGSCATLYRRPLVYRNRDIRHQRTHSSSLRCHVNKFNVVLITNGCTARVFEIADNAYNAIEVSVAFFSVPRSEKIKKTLKPFTGSVRTNVQALVVGRGSWVEVMESDTVSETRSECFKLT
ncbi:hypothetical protein EVAR_98494_1 [Eumeta japonica]|uniref:Uncharacterized protein n=1 Tax=Eumeta variegata TaxID=151549 RepID=A0A4C2AD75_EUMVA|nr:hypothetical protein EVAR_98494_1 [Eumeta japonica]